MSDRDGSGGAAVAGALGAARQPVDLRRRRRRAGPDHRGAPAAATSGSDRIAADAALYGVAGNPIVHSRSPVMHNAGFAALGLNAVYVPLEARDAEDFVRFARRSRPAPARASRAVQGRADGARRRDRAARRAASARSTRSSCATGAGLARTPTSKAFSRRWRSASPRQARASRCSVRAARRERWRSALAATRRTRDDLGAARRARRSEIADDRARHRRRLVRRRRRAGTCS